MVRLNAQTARTLGFDSVAALKKGVALLSQNRQFQWFTNRNNFV